MTTDTTNSDCILQALYSNGQLRGLQIIQGWMPEQSINHVYERYRSKHQTVQVGDRFKAKGPVGEALSCEIIRVPTDDRLPEVEIAINGLKQVRTKSLPEREKIHRRSKLADQVLSALGSIGQSNQLRSWEADAIEDLAAFLRNVADQHGEHFDSLVVFAAVSEFKPMLPDRLQPVVEVIRSILSELPSKEGSVESSMSLNSAPSESIATRRKNSLFGLAQNFLAGK